MADSEGGTGADATVQRQSEHLTGDQPLEGVRVLDVSSQLGAYCSRLLADLGADVIKVEPPEGDALRTRPPFADSRQSPEHSLMFATYHANKRGITLDTTSDLALPALAKLGATADVVVISPTREAPLVGFDWDRQELSWATADAVVASVTPFGLTGPMRHWRSTAFLSYAMSGSMHRVGHPDSPPLSIPGEQQWDEAGLYAAIGVLAALRVRSQVGGQLLDLAVHEVAASKDYSIARYDVYGLAEWGRNVPVGFPPTGTWRCRDGDFDISCYQPHHWGAFLKMLDHPPEIGRSRSWPGASAARPHRESDRCDSKPAGRPIPA